MSPIIHAASASLVAPEPTTRNEAPPAATERGFNGKKTQLDCGSRHDADQQVKRIATLRAALALRGFELRRLDGGGWLITRWNLSREAAHLDAVAAFTRQVGGVA